MRFSRHSWQGFLALFLLIALVILSRFLHLSEIPTSVAHDEMIYAVNAQSLAQSGTDITGTWDPLSLTPVHPMFAEVPTLFQAPFFSLPLEPVLATRLPFVLMSLILPFVIAGISFELFRSRGVALTTAVLAAFNPWVWQFSRMGFDSYWSLFFFCVGAFLLLRCRSWMKLWSLLPFFLGFYQYQGHKLAFLPWVGVFVIYLLQQNLQLKRKKGHLQISVNWKEVTAPLAVFLGAVAIFIFYIGVQLPQQGSLERISTMLTPNSEEIVEKVDERRRLSLASPVSKVVTNKYTVWGEELLRRYTEVFSPRHLFLTSQYSGFNVWSHGIFYAIDAALILIGICVLWKRRWAPLLLILIIGVLTTVVPAIIGGGNSYVFRPSLSIPLLLLFAGRGAYMLLQKLPRPLTIVPVSAYLFSILFFAFQYFVRYPVYAAESRYFSDKVLSRYFSLTSDQKVLVYTNEPEFTYTALVFYNDLFKHEDPAQLQQSYRERTFQIRNWRFTDECVPANITASGADTIIVRHSAEICDTGEVSLDATAASAPVATVAKIGAVKDSGTVYTLYNDALCDESLLPPYLHVRNLRSFDMWDLEKEEFCSTWLMK